MHKEFYHSQSYTVKNCDETTLLAEQLSLYVKCGDIITLIGDLGVGKTFFARAFIQALTSPFEEVVSPTFTLLQVYETNTFPIYHFDLYRITGSGELLELGFDDAIGQGVVLVEWPCRLGSFLPKARLDIKIKQGVSANSRDIRFFGHGSWLTRLSNLSQ